MLTAEYDLRYFKEAIDNLEEYLLANELYWPLQISSPRGQPPYPQITPGSILLARKRLEATAQLGVDLAEAQALEVQFVQVITQWRSAWEKKCRKDAGARLRMWSDFIDDYNHAPGANLDRYAYEVTRRVQIHLMENYTGPLPGGEFELLSALDGILHAVLLPGKFVWDAVLQPAFPESTYWYLYGELKSGGAEG